MTSTIKPGQLVTLQTLWSQYARHSLDVPRTRDREERLRWASGNIGRSIASFKELSRDEAATLINTLQMSLGRAVKDRPRPRSQSAGQAAGTHGRRGQRTNVEAIASADDHARIQDALTRLGWNEERFAGWLKSPSSPLGKMADPQVRTVAQANKVWWALKNLLKHHGAWNQR